MSRSILEYDNKIHYYQISKLVNSEFVGHFTVRIFLVLPYDKLNIFSKDSHPPVFLEFPGILFPCKVKTCVLADCLK